MTPLSVPSRFACLSHLFLSQGDGDVMATSDWMEQKESNSTKRWSSPFFSILCYLHVCLTDQRKYDGGIVS